MFSIGQFAKKTGLTVRALRFYSDKGLLEPCYISEAGHRYYNDESIVKVQKIMTLKYLDYSLEDIEVLFSKGEIGLIESLKFQRNQLEKKRKQLDNVIVNLDQAIAIGERSETIEPTLFLSVIHNLLKEDEQKEYLNQYLPKALVNKLYNYFGMNLIEMNHQYILLTHQLKKAFVEPIPDKYLQSLIEQYVMLIPQELAKEIAEALMEYELLEMDEWLFPSPFTQDEEAWFLEQAMRLGLYGGYDDE
ncbi:transcriptional regulator [Solibacillus sp. R5-41]|uniref:MerR family transcriptional regulator n=1 Tax=Solibacillus sp. R5-41 TaxID=2048654 RepID=UPI000C1292E3|nr:MerR family transcriptional regulator [Solibacillus sp. R5-41]ATP42271.1 transcriptional regulator [Solibacillus sp. R5-41]